MREPIDGGAAPLAERLRAPGIGPLLAEAEAVWRARAGNDGTGSDGDRPGWHPFEDAFPTFYQFTNRPPR